MAAFLNVETSLSKRKWIGPSNEDDRTGSNIAQLHNLSQLTGLLLAKRNVRPSEVQSFLAPKLRDSIPDPYILKDVKKTALRIIQAIHKKERICIYADYDVDGVASASILYLWFKTYTITPTIYIPDRVREGYGPNAEAMKELSKKNDLIICVDCGTVAHEPISIAKAMGVDTIILDHHLSDEKLPTAYAIVNPKRRDEEGHVDYLCASGVVFLVLVAVNRLLREKNRPTYNIMNFLDIVALATVADVVPLVALNRALVSQGLKVLAKRTRPGLVALCDIAGIKTKPNSLNLGFQIAPRINATGRLSDANLAVQLLTSENINDAYSIATKLDKLNAERKEIEETLFADALKQLEGVPSTKPFIWVAKKDWHPGVIGIIAARLKERMNKPAIVISIDKEGIAVGSARSVVGIDIGKMIRNVQKSGYLMSGGGHQMAAGLKGRQEQLEVARTQLEKEFKKEENPTESSRELHIDSLITTLGATLELVKEISSVGPFGSCNPPPRIAIANCQIRGLKVLNGKHIKFFCQDPTQKNLEAIFFNGIESVGGQRLTLGLGESFHLCGKLEINDWGGKKRVVLQVDDISLIETN